jgi:NitT/TauT family transport system substrate-binding protein
MERLTMTHGLALSNLPVFIAQEYGLFREENLEVQFLPPASVADGKRFLRTGQADMASYAFTSLMQLYDQGADIRIIAGAGILGLIVLGQADIKDWEDARGKRAATVQADPLEILLYECLTSRGVDYESLAIQYPSTVQSLSELFANRQVELVTHVEPYASQLVSDHAAKVLSDGTDLWGPRYPDCVIAAQFAVLEDRPDAVRGVLRALLKAQFAIEQGLDQACRAVAGKYFRASERELTQAAPSMPPGVDIRDQDHVILARGEAMAALGYVQRPPDSGMLDFRLLTQVIADERDVWLRLEGRPDDRENH